MAAVKAMPVQPISDCGKSIILDRVSARVARVSGPGQRAASLSFDDDTKGWSVLMPNWNGCFPTSKDVGHPCKRILKHGLVEHKLQ